MTKQRIFDHGKHSSKLDELSMFQDEGMEVFDEEATPLDHEPWEIGPEDHLDDAHQHQEAHPEGPDASYGQHWGGGGGAVGLAVGSVLTVAGICLMLTMSLAPSFAETLTGPLAKVGLTAMSLLLAGLMVSGFAFLALRQSKLVNTIRAMRDQRGSLEAGLEYLVQAQEHHLDRPPASGEELDRVLDCLQRQDEKLNNLTKAIKMYGKPLIEITNQSSESVHHLEELNTQVAQVMESLQGQDGSASASDLKDLLEGNRGLTGEDLHRELEAHLEKLEARIDDSAKRVAGGVDRLLEREGQSGEPALEEIQRGLTNLANTLAAVQKSIAGGVQSASVAPSPALQSEPSHAPQSSSPSSGSSPRIGGLAHSIAGPKKGTGKNVLGAIAKLKQMRN